MAHVASGPFVYLMVVGVGVLFCKLCIYTVGVRQSLSFCSTPSLFQLGWGWTLNNGGPALFFLSRNVHAWFRLGFGSKFVRSRIRHDCVCDVGDDGSGGDTIWGNETSHSLAIARRCRRDGKPAPVGAEGGRKTDTARAVRRAIGKQPCLEGKARALGCRVECGLLEEGDEVAALRLLLDAREDHLGARDVLRGVEQVLEEGILAPRHAYRGR